MSKACYCKDTNTYSIECCDGSLWAQGIGITRVSVVQDKDYLLQEDGFKILQENGDGLLISITSVISYVSALIGRADNFENQDETIELLTELDNC